MFAGLLAVPDVNRSGLDMFHFRFQRAPSLVSSSTMPCSSSCARISSERWKFLLPTCLLPLRNQLVDFCIAQPRLADSWPDNVKHVVK